MCGMFGYWDRHKRPLPPPVLAAMAERLRHRGPDDEGIFRGPERGVAVGNRRLSIIDLAGGHQPFRSRDGLVTVVQNGKINYVELAVELRAESVQLDTASDTEVILRLYERERIACLHRLNGWARLVRPPSAQVVQHPGPAIQQVQLRHLAAVVAADASSRTAWEWRSASRRARPSSTGG